MNTQNTEQAQKEDTDEVYVVLGKYDILGVFNDPEEAQSLADERHMAYGDEVDVVSFRLGKCREYSVPMRDWLDRARVKDKVADALNCDMEQIVSFRELDHEPIVKVELDESDAGEGITTWYLNTEVEHCKTGPVSPESSKEAHQDAIKSLCEMVAGQTRYEESQGGDAGDAQ